MFRYFCAVFLPLAFGLSTFAAVNNCCYGPGLLCSCGLHGFRAGYEEDLSEVDVEAFQLEGIGWTSTSSGPSGLGQPAELTWSMVPDGTAMPGALGEPTAPSNLISFLDEIHHGGASPGGSDLTQRAWFSLVESSFQRWDELSGITFTYEPNDDGARLPNGRGVLGVRGDHRIGGHSIDGQTSPTFLAYNYFPNLSDTVIDTDEVLRWGDATNNYLQFRNMLMHEVGHGLGFRHLVSNNSNALMEPFLATSFDGPQLDDILGLHRLYGDVNETANGNETYLDATPLGHFWPGESKSYGSDAIDTVVEFTDVDFLSIDDDNDTDFFHFTTNAPAFLNLSLTPLGPTYLEGPSAADQSLFDASAQSDLSLTLWEGDGTTILESADETGLGESESIEGIFLDRPGDYYINIGGNQNAAQFYELSLDLELPIPTNGGSFFEIVRRFGERAGFGNFLNNDHAPRITKNIPEPTAAVLLACGTFVCLTTRRRSIQVPSK